MRHTITSSLATCMTAWQLHSCSLGMQCDAKQGISARCGRPSCLATCVSNEVSCDDLFGRTLSIPVRHSPAHMSGVRPVLLVGIFTSAWPLSTRKRTAPVDPARACAGRPVLLRQAFYCHGNTCPQRSLSTKLRVKTGPISGFGLNASWVPVLAPIRVQAAILLGIIHRADIHQTGCPHAAIHCPLSWPYAVLQ